MIASRVLPVVSLAVLSLLSACSSAPEVGSADGRTEEARSAVIRGKSSDGSQDAVVMLVHYDPAAQGVGSCTGTLLAPNLVLTARHCVADTDEGAACKSDGTPIAGGVVGKTHPASSLYVFTGTQRPNFEGGRVEPDGRGKKIFDDGGKNICNHDIALVLLEAPIKDAQIMPVRLESDVTVGELITAVGWGVTDKTTMPQTRQQRKDVKITSVGPDDSTRGDVPPNEFEVGEAICSGDSGGPAIAEDTNSVVGVVSRGGNASGGDGTDPASNCIGGTNLYTKISPFKDLLVQAFEAAGAEPWIEGGPDPRKAKAKEPCSTNDDCRSALCLPDPSADGADTCAEDCSSTQECSVEGEVCTTEEDVQICRAPKRTHSTTTTTTCTASAPGGASAGGGAAAVFGLLALASLRRKRRSPRRTR
jgi:MYXO-CTERM domain-containing protein